MNTVRSLVGLCLALPAAVGCDGALDAGRDMPHHSVADGAADATDDVILDASEDAARALLPVDERSPVIVMNDDWSGDWLGEYAVLLANTGGPPLAGIIVKASSIWGDLSINASGWEGLVVDARSSGLKGIPDVTASVGGPLTRPADGQIDSTVPNRSTGAQLIVDVSRRWSQPSLPVVVAVATELTDVADAYLIDPTVVDRVVVVASLGSFAAPDALMGAVNGDMDPWADWIVAHRFRYVQVNAWYDQTGDVTTADFPSLPQNAMGDRIRKRQPDIIASPAAADQVALFAAGLPRFAVAVERMSTETLSAFDTTQGPRLVPDANGHVWVVTQVQPSLPRSRLWPMLLDPRTFGLSSEPAPEPQED